MARPRKNGKKATGIRADKGKLYIVRSYKVKNNGKDAYKKEWIPTGLTDTADNVKLAKKMREDILNADKEGKLYSDITLGEYITEYLAESKTNDADTTYSKKLFSCKYILRYFGAETKIKKITPEDVKDFYKWLLQQKVKSGNEKKTISRRYAEDIQEVFKNQMATAIEKKYIAKNPSLGIGFDTSKLNKKKKKTPDDETFFDYEEAMRFLDILKNDEYVQERNLRLIFELVLFFGLRREEIYGLCWSAISFERKTLTVCKTVTRGTCVKENEDVKTESSLREYPLTDSQVNELMERKSMEEEYREQYGITYNENDFLLKKADGTRYGIDFLNKAFKKIVKKYPELPQKITLHGLRASCVSILAHGGWDLKSIQDWVGHADADTTQNIYNKVKSKKGKRETAAKLEELFYKKKEE